MRALTTSTSISVDEQKAKQSSLRKQKSSISASKDNDKEKDKSSSFSHRTLSSVEMIQRRYHNFLESIDVMSNVLTDSYNMKSSNRNIRKKYSKNYLIHPQSKWKMIWDTLMCSLICYTILVVPVQIAFSIGFSYNYTIADYIIDALFFTDLLFSFNLSYEDPTTGEMITDRRVIAINYVKFWFWIDLISSVPIDLFVHSIYDSNRGLLRTARLLRIIRLARMIKIIRYAKFNKYINRLQDFNINPLVFRFLQLLVNMMVMAHILACFWFYMASPDVTGANSLSSNRTWVTEFGFDRSSIFDQYIASLYWVMMSIVTVGYGDIHATNNREQIYSMFVMLCGSVMLGGVISQVTRLMNSYNPQTKAFNAKLNELKLYLNNSLTDLPLDLKFRTIDAYSYYLRKRSAYAESNIFDELPDVLLKKLLTNVYASEIRGITAFHSLDQALVLDIMTFGRPFHATAREKICHQGDICMDVFFLVRGLIRLTVNDGIRDIVVGFVTQGSYFGDIEFSLKSTYKATYEAVIPSRLFAINSNALTQAMNRNPIGAEEFLRMCRARYSQYKSVIKKDLLDGILYRDILQQPRHNDPQEGGRKDAISLSYLNPFSPKAAALRSLEISARDKLEAISPDPFGLIGYLGNGSTSRRGRSRSSTGEEQHMKLEMSASAALTYDASYASPSVVNVENPTKTERNPSTIRIQPNAPALTYPKRSDSYSKVNSSDIGAEMNALGEKSLAEQQLIDIFSPKVRVTKRSNRAGRKLSTKAMELRRELFVDTSSNPVVASTEFVPPFESSTSTALTILDRQDNDIPLVIDFDPTETDPHGSLLAHRERSSSSSRIDHQLPAETFLPVSTIELYRHQLSQNASQHFHDRKYLWIDGEERDVHRFSSDIEKLFETYAAPFHVLVESIDKSIKIDRMIELNASEIFHRYYVIHPSHQWKVAWDSFIGLLILYSAIVIPVEVAFSSFHVLKVFEYMVDGFFFIDMIISARCAYFDYSRDAWICVPRVIILHYLRTWFLIDTLSFVPFDSLVSISGDYSGGTLSIIRLLKILRLFRMAKLIRIVQFSELINKIEHYSGISSTMVELLKIVIQVLIIAHFTACFWWGTTANISSQSWADDLSQVYSDLTKASVTDQYTASLYWTIATLTTTGYGDITAINTEERVISIVVIAFGATVFAYVVGNIASMMTKLTYDDRQERIHHIRDYLREKQCSKSLTTGIVRHLERKYERESTVNEEAILSSLPTHISNELLKFQHYKTMKSIPLFEYLDNNSVKLCILKIMTVKYFDRGQVLLRDDKHQREVLFLVSGTADVFQVKKKRRKNKRRRSSLRMRLNLATFINALRATSTAPLRSYDVGSVEEDRKEPAIVSVASRSAPISTKEAVISLSRTVTSNDLTQDLKIITDQTKKEPNPSNTPSKDFWTKRSEFFGFRSKASIDTPSSQSMSSVNKPSVIDQLQSTSSVSDTQLELNPTVVRAAYRFRELHDRKRKSNEEKSKLAENLNAQTSRDTTRDTSSSELQRSNNGKNDEKDHVDDYYEEDGETEDDGSAGGDDEREHNAETDIHSSAAMSPSKDYRLIGQIESGDFIGLVSMIHRRRNTITVRATMNCRVYCLRSSAIKKLQEDHPIVAYHLRTSLGKILRDQRRELASRHIRQNRAGFLKACKKEFINRREQDPKVSSFGRILTSRLTDMKQSFRSSTWNLKGALNNNNGNRIDATLVNNSSYDNLEALTVNFADTNIHADRFASVTAITGSGADPNKPLESSSSSVQSPQWSLLNRLSISRRNGTSRVRRPSSGKSEASEDNYKTRISVILSNEAIEFDSDDDLMRFKGHGGDNDMDPLEWVDDDPQTYSRRGRSLKTTSRSLIRRQSFPSFDHRDWKELKTNSVLV